MYLVVRFNMVLWTHRLTVRTHPFHGWNRDSNSLGFTNHVGFTMTWERSRNRKNFAAVSIQQSDRRAKSGRSFAIVV